MCDLPYDFTVGGYGHAAKVFVIMAKSEDLLESQHLPITPSCIENNSPMNRIEKSIAEKYDEYWWYDRDCILFHK